MRCSLLLLCVWLGGSQAQAAPIRQGFVDMQKALNQVCDGRRAKRQLRAYKRRFQAQLNLKRQKLRRWRKATKSRPRISPRARLRYKMQVQTKLLELQRLYTQLKKKLAQLETQQTKAIFAKMQKLLVVIARKHKLIFIFEKAQSGLLYADKRRDFTPALIRLYQRRYCRSN